MNELKNRVLSDRGFVNQSSPMDTSKEAVYALQGKVKKLTRMLEDSKEAFRTQRNLELADAKDTITQLEREVATLKKSLAKAEGKIKQLEKEAK